MPKLKRTYADGTVAEYDVRSDLTDPAAIPTTGAVTAGIAAGGGGSGVTRNTHTHSSAGALSIPRAAADQATVVTISANATSWADNLTTDLDHLHGFLVGNGGSTSYTVDLVSALAGLDDVLTIHPDTEIEFDIVKRGANLWSEFKTRAAGSAPSLLVDAGVIAHGGTLPASIQAGDLIYLCGISTHTEAGTKDMTAPAGYSDLASLAPYVAGTFNPDHHWVKKTAVLADASSTVTFGGNIGASIAYFVVRSATTETIGTGASNYVSSVDLPSVAAAGLHLVVFSASDSTDTVGATPANYTKQGDASPGFGTTAAFTRDNAPNPTGAVTFTSSGDASLAATSIVVS